MIYILLFLLLCLSAALFVALSKSIRINKQYEEFYEQSLEEFKIIDEALSKILMNKPLFSEDFDVQMIIKALIAIQDTLSEYQNAQTKKTARKSSPKAKE